jgi:hypothetical protein
MPLVDNWNFVDSGIEDNYNTSLVDTLDRVSCLMLLLLSSYRCYVADYYITMVDWTFELLLDVDLIYMDDQEVDTT